MKTLALTLLFAILVSANLSFAQVENTTVPLFINGKPTDMLIDESGTLYQVMPEEITAEKAMANYKDMIRHSIVTEPTDEVLIEDVSKKKFRVPSLSFQKGSELRFKKLKSGLGQKFYALDLELGDALYPEFVHANADRSMHLLLGCTSAGKIAREFVFVRNKSEIVCGAGARYVREFTNLKSLLGF